MTVRAASKYIFFSICPGLAGRFKYFGTSVYFPKASAVFRLACEKGIYEPEVTDWLCRLAQPEQLFIDVGANIGLTSIPVLRAVRGVHVLSFEPSPNSLPYLERTWQGSDFKNRWDIVPKAAGESAGKVEFCVGAARYAGWDGLKDTKRVGERHPVEVPQTTVDAEWDRLGCPPVSCVKIDVEGAETKVLGGCEEVIRRQRPYVLLEWNQENLDAYGTDADALWHYATSHEYDLVAFPSLNPVSGLHMLRLHMLHTEMFLLVPKRTV